jgi:hypothetical protein
MIWLGAAWLSGPAARAAAPAPANGARQPKIIFAPAGQTGAPPARRTWRREQAPVETNALYAIKTVPLFDSKDKPVQLRNYHKATNVSLQRLMAFVRTNPVNLAAFEPGKFVCTEFGQSLHNGAEAAGLRCGLVFVEFERGEGHVLNAFETTDKGIVYVDCTGSLTPNAPRAEFDTFGYLKVGKKYGRLQLDIGSPDPNHYERFEIVEQARIQLENDRATCAREWKKLLAEDQALAAEERKLGPPPWPPALKALGDGLRQRREALDKKNAGLRQLQHSVQTRSAQMRGGVFHSNPAPVARFKTWW